MRRFAGLLVLVCLVATSLALFVRYSHKGTTVREKAHALKQVIAPKTLPLAEAANPQHKIECEAVVSHSNPNGAIVKAWNVYGAHGDVRVRSAYYHVDLEHKRSLDRALRCVMSEGREEDQGLKQVTYRNARNDQLVAMWERSGGFKMAE